MPTVKLTLSIDSSLLAELDRIVKSGQFSSRSEAVHALLQEKLSRSKLHRLATECAKLEPAAERKFADVGLNRDISAWPNY